MIKINIEDLYSNIIQEIKSHNIKVKHLKIKDDDYGECDVKNRVITLNSNYKNTHEGCITAYHEWGHIIDYEKGKYPDFYNDSYIQWENYNNIKKLVLEAEWSCYNFAKNKLKKYKIFNNCNSLKKSWVKKYILPLWLEDYKVLKK